MFVIYDDKSRYPCTYNVLQKKQENQEKQSYVRRICILAKLGEKI